MADYTVPFAPSGYQRPERYTNPYVGTLLELKGENPFKTRAYHNAARVLEGLTEPLETVVAEQRTRSVIVRARPTDFPLMESLIKQLENFAGVYGPAFYGLPRNTQKITLIKEIWDVPKELPYHKDTLVPFRSGGTVAWRMA